MIERFFLVHAGAETLVGAEGYAAGWGAGESRKHDRREEVRCVPIPPGGMVSVRL